MEKKIKKISKSDIRRMKIRIIKKLVIRGAILLILIVMIVCNINKKDKNKEQVSHETISYATNANEEKKELGWELALANKDHKIPKDYAIKLKSIDKYREIDARVYQYYIDMLNDMKKDGIQNIWAQSCYRSFEEQEEVFNDKVEFYEKLGKTREEAEMKAEEIIMRPGYSDHNLGLAVDFNYVDDNFEDLKGFKWLKENAQEYGFILRYPKDKEDITKVKYEPWHWRYVGIDNAKEMNKKNMCLEEYVEYLQQKV